MENSQRPLPGNGLGNPLPGKLRFGFSKVRQSDFLFRSPSMNPEITLDGDLGFGVSGALSS